MHAFGQNIVTPTSWCASKPGDTITKNTFTVCGQMKENRLTKRSIMWKFFMKNIVSTQWWSHVSDMNSWHNWGKFVSNFGIGWLLGRVNRVTWHCHMTIRFLRSAHSGPNNHSIHTSKFCQNSQFRNWSGGRRKKWPRNVLGAYPSLWRPTPSWPYSTIDPIKNRGTEAKLRCWGRRRTPRRCTWWDSPARAESWRGTRRTAGSWRATERHRQVVECRCRGWHYSERPETELGLGGWACRVHPAASGEGPATAPDKNASQKGRSSGWVGDGDNSSATDDRREGTCNNGGRWCRDQRDQAVGLRVSAQAHHDQHKGQVRSSKIR